MLRRRPTQTFKAVSLFDPSLDGIPEDAVDRYSQSRDFAEVEEHLAACLEKPTVFTFSPLRPEHEHLMNDPSPGALWLIFKSYLQAVENIDLDGENIWEPGSGRAKLKDSARELFPPAVVQEMGLLVQEYASRFDSVPFSVLGSWRLDRRKRERQAATAAIIETASGTL